MIKLNETFDIHHLVSQPGGVVLCKHLKPIHMETKHSKDERLFLIRRIFQKETHKADKYYYNNRFNELYEMEIELLHLESDKYSRKTDANSILKGLFK